MSEINLATAEKPELKAYADKELDLSLTMNFGRDKMVELILAQCKTLNREPPTSSIGVAKVDKKTGKQEKRYVVNIAKQKGGDENCFVGVQGVGFLIPRGMDVIVPARVVEVLKNAVQDDVTQDKDGKILHNDVQMEPYSTREVTEADIAAAA